METPRKVLYYKVTAQRASPSKTQKYVSEMSNKILAVVLGR